MRATLPRMAPKPAAPDAKGDSREAPDSYEAHLEALDRVIADLEGDALSLEGTIDRYKEGVAHLGSCRKILDAAERRLAELVSAPDGGVEERALEVGPEGLVDVPPASRDASLAARDGAVSQGLGGDRMRATRAKPAAGSAPAAFPATPPADDVGDDLPF